MRAVCSVGHLGTSTRSLLVRPLFVPSLSAQIAGTIHPYPTTQESIRQACLGYNKYYKDPAAAPLATLRKVMAAVEEEEAAGASK